jgi:hypothetical protein
MDDQNPILRSLTIVDEAGNPRIYLHADGPVAGINLYGPDSPRQLAIQVDTAGNHISMRDSAGQMSLGIGAGEEGTGIMFYKGDGTIAAHVAYDAKRDYLIVKANEGTTVKLAPPHSI